MSFDHRIDWDNVKIPKSDLHAYRRHLAKIFFKKMAHSLNEINCNDGANFPAAHC